MCILHVQQCSECSDKFSFLQYLEGCEKYYNTKEYCDNITTELKLYVCDNCSQST